MCASAWKTACGCKGQLAKTNADQVSKIRRILEELGLEVATPDDARKILKLKGRNNVNF